MVSFFGITWISMCIPFFIKCKTCRYVYFTNSYEAKCKKFLFINNKSYFIPKDKIHNYEDNLFLNIETIRKNNELCGINASYYDRRIQ